MRVCECACKCVCAVFLLVLLLGVNLRVSSDWVDEEGNAKLEEEHL